MKLSKSEQEGLGIILLLVCCGSIFLGDYIRKYIFFNLINSNQSLLIIGCLLVISGFYMYKNPKQRKWCYKQLKKLLNKLKDIIIRLKNKYKSEDKNGIN